MINPEIKSKLEDLVDLIDETYKDVIGFEIECEKELDENGIKYGFSTLKKFTVVYKTREEIKLN